METIPIEAPPSFPPTTFAAFDGAGRPITEVDSITSVDELVAYWSTRPGSHDEHGNPGAWTARAYFDHTAEPHAGVPGIPAYVVGVGAPKFVELVHPITGGLEFQFSRVAR